mgnify:CR=1 FL=1
MAQLFVGLMAEGATDYRFLKPIVEKTLVQIAHDCTGQIDIDVFNVEYIKDGGFVDYVFSASKKGFNEFGIMILVIHADADALSPNDVYDNKINPAKSRIGQEEEEICKNIAALVPVYETESWMFADKAFLKKQIGTKMLDADLGIDGSPESFSRPKERIEEAIRIGREELPPKIRHRLKIDDLYSIMGEAIQTEKLLVYESYNDFVRNIRRELVQLRLLNE